MAAVTINGKPIENVIGNQRQIYYNITFTTGQTLDVPLRKLLAFTVDPNSSLTAVSYSTSAISTGTRVTLTGSGTASKVTATGH